MLFPLDTLKDTSRHMGDYFSWNVPPSYPKSGEEWGVQERVKGYMISSSNRRFADGSYRSGSGFLSVKFRTNSDAPGPTTTFRGGSGRAYIGTYYVANASMYDYSSMEMANDDADSVQAKAFAYGAQAMAKLRPDRPDFTPFVSIGELLTELPGLHGRVKNVRDAYLDRVKVIERRENRKLSRVAKFHLQLQFGLLPVMSDIQNWWEAYRGAVKRAQQLVKDNGKWVRRRVFLTPKPADNFQQAWVSNLATAYNGDMKPIHVTQCYSTNTAIGGGKASTVCTYRVQTQVWAVGKSKYWLPSDMVQTPAGFARLHRKIHASMDLNLDNVYNLIPWSWLLDYFFKFGDFFAAISGGISNTLIWDYVYVMRSQEHEERFEYTQYVYKSPTTCGKTTCTLSRTGTLKSRVYGSVFGFGPTTSDLTPSQLGILGALGLSRL